jgi:hypothetical protein
LTIPREVLPDSRAGVGSTAAKWLLWFGKKNAGSVVRLVWRMEPAHFK